MYSNPDFDNFLKFILVSCILILLSSFKMQAQVISNSVSDGVYYYFTKNIKKRGGKEQSWSENIHPAIFLHCGILSCVYFDIIHNI